MSDENLVPYDQTPLNKKIHGRGLAVTLLSGSEVRVFVCEDHPHSGGRHISHDFRRDQPDGTRSQLKFAVTPEAALAVAALYVVLGVASLNDIAALALAIADHQDAEAAKAAGENP